MKSPTMKPKGEIRMRIIIMAAILIIPILFIVPSALSEEGKSENPEQHQETGVPPPEVHLWFQTYFLFTNDTDFDRTKPLYSDYGQTSGFVSTTFRPSLTWRPHPNVTLQYTLEVGDNIWSRNNLDELDPHAEDIPLVRHKEVWAEITSPKGAFGIKPGYQYIYDPTHMFVDKYMGAAKFFYRHNQSYINIGAGLIPDTTYEGFSATGIENQLKENNFENDNALFFADSKAVVSDQFGILPAVYFRYDKSIIHRPLVILNPCVRFSYSTHRISTDIDLAMQWGRFTKGSLNQHDEELLSGAVQFLLKADLSQVELLLHALALTPDDGDKFDGWSSGYVYSGFSNGRTLFLSKNWLFDLHSNLDLKAAAQQAGPLLVDEELDIKIIDGLKIMAIAGYEMVLDTTETDGGRMVGVETNLGFDWSLYQNHVDLYLIGGGIFPGKAGAMLQNNINKDRLDSIYHMQSSFNVQF